MGKICKECGLELEDDARFCTRCGTKQEESEKEEPKKKRFNLFKKKEKIIPSRMTETSEMEDFSLYPHQISKSKQNKDELVVDALIRIEQKLDGLLSNNNWLLMNLENYIQGFKQPSKKDVQENN